MLGTVKFYNTAKAFGFITPDGGGKDILIVPSGLTASGITSLSAGQRLSFETEPGTKGPKAVRLKLEDKPAPPAEIAAMHEVKVYHDPGAKESAAVLAALKTADEQPSVIDYMASPPTLEKLRQLAYQLRSQNQSLVRRYHPLFLELQLDDRFLSETDFWTAVMEHPTLINGPVVTAGSRACICKSEADVRHFLDPHPRAIKQPKSISSRLAALINGTPLPPEPSIIASEPEPAPVVKVRKSATKNTAKMGKKKVARPSQDKLPKTTKKAAKPKKQLPKKRKSR